MTGHNRIGQAEFCYIVNRLRLKEIKWKTKDLQDFGIRRQNCPVLPAYI